MNVEQEPVNVERQVEKLGQRITLPVTPTEVWFDEVARGKQGGIGPTDLVLIAAMRFERDALARITGAAQPRPGAPPRLSNVAQQPWLPEPVQAAIQPHDEHSVSVRGTKFDAAPFAKSPFSSGTFVAIDGGEYVLLVMETR